MKFRFLKMTWPADIEYRFEEAKWVIQKKGWFGWKYLISPDIYLFTGRIVYDINYSWSYAKPGRKNYGTFYSKKHCLLFLKTYYNKLQPKCEC